NGTRDATTARVVRALPPGRIAACGSVELIGEGCAIGVERVSNRPRLVIDVAAARRAGLDLDSRLLRLARVLR
ncbi:MAG: YfiR/HmsC family protein, partial [Myxococcota bacterium]